MIRLKNILKISLQQVLKTPWRRLEDVFARRFEEILKTSRRHICKTSWRRLENVLKTSWRPMAKTNVLVLTKASWRRLLKTTTKDVFKTSSRHLHQHKYLVGSITNLATTTALTAVENKIPSVSNLVKRKWL